MDEYLFVIAILVGFVGGLFGYVIGRLIFRLFADPEMNKWKAMVAIKKSIYEAEIKEIFERHIGTSDTLEVAILAVKEMKRDRKKILDSDIH